MRKLLLDKYRILPAPPIITKGLEVELGSPPVGSNDYVDNLMLAAVSSNSVNYLVTNDQGIHRKAVRIGLKNRVLYPSVALATINALLPQGVLPPPSVRLTYCHELNKEDPIFSSLRADYSGFDGWLDKCQLDHRQVFIVNSDGLHGAIAILKDEGTSLNQKVLKICTFKVAEHARGFKFGELLLKAIFDFAIKNDFDQTYCTCFPKQHQLLELLDEFGFEPTESEPNGEIRAVKFLRPKDGADQLTPLEFHVKYGPRNILPTDNIFLVPIEPKYHRLLFPELETQVSFWNGETAFGNSIRKAYLCHSPTKMLSPGDLLLFYRSQDFRNIQALGVVESTIRTSSPLALMEYVGQRTVYSKAEIEELCQSEVLAILFRQVSLNVRITLDQLRSSGAVLSPPQSITRIRKTAVPWIQKMLVQ
ncbi:MAG: GNAT family N-acetyltransferase [Pirellulaceae bacterium]